MRQKPLMDQAHWTPTPEQKAELEVFTNCDDASGMTQACLTVHADTISQIDFVRHGDLQ